MSTISTSSPGRKNDRHELRRAGPGNNLPIPTLSGAVEFSLVSDCVAGTLSLSIVERTPSTDSELRLVDATNGGNRYLRIPTGQTVQIDFILAGPWQWSFGGTAGGVTLADRNNGTRYWLAASPDSKTRRVIIQPSNKPVLADENDPTNDEKFNLEIEIEQSAGSPLAIEIDPITKNPPPVGGVFDPNPLVKPGPLL
jgi:hypothetical protein